MKTNILVQLLSLVAMAGSVFAQDTDEKKEPLTISQALKLGEEGLTEYTGLSEVGQDQAAELYATAKRITTEQGARAEESPARARSRRLAPSHLQLPDKLYVHRLYYQWRRYDVWPPGNARLRRGRGFSRRTLEEPAISGGKRR